MKLPILHHHQHERVIGYLESSDNNTLTATFFNPVSYKVFWSIFSGAGVRLLETRQTAKGKQISIVKAEIFEFSCSAKSPHTNEVPIE